MTWHDFGFARAHKLQRQRILQAPEVEIDDFNHGIEKDPQNSVKTT